MILGCGLQRAKKRVEVSRTMGSNTGDQFANLGRALSTTASVLFSAQPMEETILSYSSPYKKLLHETITNTGGGSSLVKMHRDLNLSKGKNKGFQDIYANSKEFFKNSYSDSKTTFKVLSYLSDDLLEDVPRDTIPKDKNLITESGEKRARKSKKQDSTLFQGFEASLPVINETIEIQQKVTMNSDMKPITDSESSVSNIEEEQRQEFSLPNHLKAEKLNNSYSSTYLKEAAKSITDNLDLLEIQKNLAASEIRELDIKLEKLKLMRELVFKRVAKIEQHELFLEKHLNNVKDRVDMIIEYNMDKEISSSDDELLSRVSESSPRTGETNEDYETAATTPLELKDDDASPLLSKSIYQQLQAHERKADAPETKKAGSSKKLKDAGMPNRHRHRKTYPTLQQFYETGSKIASFPKAHEEEVICLDFDMPFGTMCSAGSLDHLVRVWDLSKKKQIAAMSGHLASISCMQMDQYSTLVTGGRDAVLKLWDIDKAISEDNGDHSEDTDACVYTFDSHVDEITAVSFDGDNLVSGSQDRTVRQWDLNKGKCTQTIDISFATGPMRSQRNAPLHNSVLLTKEPPAIGALQCFDAALATGTKDGVVRLWDLRSGKVVRVLEGHTDAITSLQFDSINLVTGSMDRSIRIWDLRTGTLSDVFAYEKPITSLHFDLDKIVISNNEPTIKIYDRENGNHWFCGEENSELGDVEFVRYKHGYLVEGRSTGDINTWAI
ncbi:unnamed protein product [Kluyveromyces dobzhanskii CBS 2104]|uniref:WGS project CCBQ000000000 data, contig 00058 n=1 Tax=Kluyveromyces dobzhanskii CBS 2104 TaxID=1427455 RepID=A0A0A8LDG0_9SACH|nr:unnamed protein product [Kluyveromyces dobzhanskii CBS 2104]